jgi:hypothetical protein
MKSVIVCLAALAIQATLGYSLAASHGDEGFERVAAANSGERVAAGKERGARFYVSGMCAKAGGISDADLAGKPAEFAMPQVLVKLAAAADVVLTY